MTNVSFGRRKDGRVYPKKSVQKISRSINKIPKKITIHGLAWAGYVVDYADNLRHKSLSRAVDKYGKTDTMHELIQMRKKYEGNERMKRVIDSDIDYLAKGKFEED